MKLHTLHKQVELTVLKCYYTFPAHICRGCSPLPGEPWAGSTAAGSPSGGAGWGESSPAALDATSTFHNPHAGLLFQRHSLLGGA